MSNPLECRDLGYRVGGQWLVSEVSLAVEGGEVLAVAGPNGAGKSTLLALLAGDIRPTTGEVLVAGRPLKAYRAPELARLRAVLPQASPLQFAFTVRQVVELGRSPWWRDNTSDDDRVVEAAMAATGVGHLAGRSYLSLSGGEATRVSLARVLAQDTAVVLLDEPTANLDLRHQELAMTVARGLASEGRTVVVVLHDLNLASAHADRLAVMCGGTLAASGAPASVLTEELLSTVYEHPVSVVTHPHRGCPLVLADG